MDVRKLARWVSASIGGRFRRWGKASRRNAVERTTYRASGGRSYPSREAAQPRHPQDAGFDAGGADGG